MDAARVYRVGRDPGNDIVIEHGSVSREHCELSVLDDGAVLLADLASMNGTAVRQNGQWEQIEQATVERDERILLGEIVTTVAALLARAPKASDRAQRAAEGARDGPGMAAAPRKIPRPTLPAKPEQSGLIGRLIHNDWARLHRRSSDRKIRRDEPSICLPAIVSAAEGARLGIADPEASARLVRNPPSLLGRRPPTTPVAGFGSARHSIALASPLPDASPAEPPAPVDFAALAAAPMLGSPGPAAPAATDPAAADGSVAPPRQEPSLRVGSIARPDEPGVAARPFIRKYQGAPAKSRRGPRWLPRPSSPAFAKWAVVGSALLLTSGAAVAAYLTYAPKAAPETHMAAATPHRAAPDERAPGDGPGASPAAKPADERKPADKPGPAAATARHRLWQLSIEGTPESAIHAAAAARDGLCLAGVTSLAAGGHEAWLIRLEANGAVRWQRRPGGPKRDAALAVTAASDGGCVAAGYDNDEARLWIFKIDAKGVLAWSRTVPTGHSGRAVAIQRTRDGGFAVAANAKAAADRPDRAFVLRLTPKGEIKWSKFAGKGESLAADLRETPDGGFVVAGTGREKGASRHAVWAARLDRNGRTVWDEHYDGPGTPAGARIEIARGRDFIIAATMTGLTPAAGDSPGAALRLLRLAADGEVIWDRRHGGAARRVAGLVLAPGGIFVAGDAGPDAAELWLAQFDANGRALRESRLPAAKADRAAALTETADGRLVLAGTAEIEGTAQRGAGLIFLDRGRPLIAER